MKKIIIILLLIIPLISKSQYLDIGMRLSKFNNGIVSKISLGGKKGENKNIWGLEIFLAKSYVANYGHLANISVYKNWNLNSNAKNLYLVTQLGFNLAKYKEFYRINDNYTGLIYYKDLYTQNYSITSHIGIEWISNSHPVTLGFMVNPWYDIKNKGPEFMDINFNIKFQLKSF